MPLIDLQTNLRDLKYGNDRPNGNSSNQPYLAKSFVNIGSSNANLPASQVNVGVIDVGNFQLSPVGGALAIGAGAGIGLGVGALLGGPIVGALVGGAVGAGAAAIGINNAQSGNSIGSGTTIGGTFNLPQIDLSLGNTPDFLVRGGIANPAYGFQDTFRLSSYFLDFKSPSGLFFSLKQNLLSRLSVRTEASANIFNDGLYSPTSTLAQAGVVGIGLHLNKQGLNPLRDRDSYRQAVQYDQYSDIGDDPTYDKLTEYNRLVALYRLKILEDPDYDSVVTINGIKIDRDDDVNLLEYSGGPDSILGIGKTKIKLYCGGTRNRVANREDTDRTSITFEIGKETKNKFKPFRPTSEGIIPVIPPNIRG